MSVGERKEYYLVPGTILQNEYVVEDVLQESSVIVYAGHRKSTKVKVLIEEDFYPELNIREAGNKQVAVRSEAARERYLYLLRQREEILDHMVMLYNWCGVGYYREYFRENGTQYAIREYVTGETLDNYLARRGTMSLSAAVSVASNIAMRLEKLHEFSQYHGCLAPQNIFMQTDGGIGILNTSLCSFCGLGKRRPLTCYSAPEQYEGINESEADVYGLAGIFYTMLTRNPIPSAAERMRGKAVKRPSEMGISLPRGIEIALIQALQLDRHERMTLKDFRQALLLPQHNGGQKTFNAKANLILCMGCMQYYSKNSDNCPHCGRRSSSRRRHADDIELGTVIAKRYVLGTRIGRGAFGITYIGYDLETGTRLAVKEYMPKDEAERKPDQMVTTLNLGDVEDIRLLWKFDEGRQRVLDEARLMKQFARRQEIVKVFDCVRENNTVYIVMEYLEGETLKECLKRRKQLPEEEAIEKTVQILKGVQRMHFQNVIHRDIAPDNIFILKNGQIKILDFGAARYVTAQSTTHPVILKRGYAPPEQYKSNGRIGPWTDVYAVAATLYQMLTGLIPPEPMYRAQDGELMLSQLGVKVSKKTERVLKEALALDYTERVSSAEEFEARLLEAARKSPSGRLKDFFRGKSAGNMRRENLRYDDIPPTVWEPGTEPEGCRVTVYEEDDF